jgi:hypothetical protein
MRKLCELWRRRRRRRNEILQVPDFYFYFSSSVRAKAPGSFSRGRKFKYCLIQVDKDLVIKLLK